MVDTYQKLNNLWILGVCFAYGFHIWNQRWPVAGESLVRLSSLPPRTQTA
jgi:hypothetical protein